MAVSSGTANRTLPADEQILITREFDAPKHLVYKAFTTPELVKRWWHANRGEMTVAEIDLRVGGKWRYVMVADGDFEVGFHGEYREIVPNERIVSTEVYEGMPDAEAVNTMTLTEADGRTTLEILVQHASKEHRDAHIESGMEAGMQDAMDLRGGRSLALELARLLELDEGRPRNSAASLSSRSIDRRTWSRTRAEVGTRGSPGRVFTNVTRRGRPTGARARAAWKPSPRASARPLIQHDDQQPVTYVAGPVTVQLRLNVIPRNPATSSGVNFTSARPLPLAAARAWPSGRPRCTRAVEARREDVEGHLVRARNGIAKRVDLVRVHLRTVRMDVHHHPAARAPASPASSRRSVW